MMFDRCINRFITVRVRVAHEDQLRSELRDEQWLFIEWPEDEEAPTRYWFSTLSQHCSLKKLISTAKMRWRIERDYQELKDELGLNHYEGRNWRGFHPGGVPHHATLCVVSYVFNIT
jgi:SRSO17 transposase